VPLGGPKVQEIVSKYNNPQNSDDDEDPESGEGQGLGTNSSLRGSPSALTGVGAAHHQANGSGQERQMTTVNPVDLDQLGGLPAYQPPETHDTEMKDGLHDSIEVDEGIDMSGGRFSTTGFTAINQVHTDLGNGKQPWNFDALDGSNRPSELENKNRLDKVSVQGSLPGLDEDILDDAASDRAMNASTASSSSFQDRIATFEATEPVDDNGEPWQETSPVPDVDENVVDTLQLHRDLVTAFGHQNPAFNIISPADEEDDIDLPAAEIHLDDADELKME
jgi:ubiquitin carboxyl-terminal hydrolase 4/11/15